MKGKLTLIILFFLCAKSFSQEYSSYDKAMISISKEIASRIKTKQKIKVAVWDFTNNKKQKSSLGDYIRSDFSIHFTNASEGMEVTNRDNFEQILKEHNLVESGLISPSTAKKVGMLHAADAIITGTIDVGLHMLRLRIKVIDTETGLHFAAALRNIPIDENMKYILKDIGFEAPIEISNEKRVNDLEKANNPRSTNKKCENLHTGDYCFTNETKEHFLIDISGIDNRIRRSNSVTAYQKTCFFDLPEGTYRFNLYKNNLRIVTGGQIKGSYRIERCQSLTYKIINTKSSSRSTVNEKPSSSSKQSNLNKIFKIIEPIINNKKSTD